MKRILLFAALTLCSADFVAQGLESIIVEKFYISDEADFQDAEENFAVYPLHPGSVTYRVYVDMLPGYKFIQMFGSPEHTLRIETTTSFYNDPNYGFSVYQGTSVNNTKKNTTLIDSYLTAGGVANGLMGVLKTEDTDGSIGNLQGILANDDPDAGLPVTGTNGADGLMPGSPVLPNTLGVSTALEVFDQTAGSVFETNNGTIVGLGGVLGITPSNHVLIGQFTTDGTLSFRINVQILTPEGGNEVYVAENPVGNELSIPSLIYESDPVTWVPEHSLSVGCIAFPNPCEDVLNLRWKNAVAGVSDISVSDELGRIVIKEKCSGESCDLYTGHLSPGIYVAKVEGKQGAEIIRFMKK